MNIFLAIFSLWHREIVRFYRQRARVVGALVPPILFWFLIGSGLSRSFQVPDAVGLNYLQFFFPGTLAMIVLFTSIFSTISIIEDRHEGFLQSVWVAPVPRAAIALGKILGGATLAFLQALLFLLCAPFLGATGSILHLGYALILLALLSVGLTGLGFMIAWKMDSTQGFHSVMNLLLMPMWFLSGSLFPVEGTPRWLHLIMTINPMTYGVAGLKMALYSSYWSHTSQWMTPFSCLLFSLFFAILTLGGSTILCHRND